MRDFGENFSVGGDEDFFQGAALLQDAMDGEGVEKFVGENTANGDAGWDFDGGAALPFSHEMREMGAQLVAAGGRTLYGDVVDGVEKIGQMSVREFEDVACEAAGAGGGFDEQKFGGAIELLPHFGELAGKETAEDGVDVDAGVVVAEAAGFGLGIVTVNGMVEALAHVFGEGDGAEAADPFGEERGERGHAEAAPVGLCF